MKRACESEGKVLESIGRAEPHRGGPDVRFAVEEVLRMRWVVVMRLGEPYV